MKLLGVKEKVIAMAKKNVVKFVCEDGVVKKSNDGTCFVVLAPMDLTIPANGTARAGVYCPVPFVLIATNSTSSVEVHSPGQVIVPNRGTTAVPFSAGEPMARLYVLDNSNMSAQEVEPE